MTSLFLGILKRATLFFQSYFVWCTVLPYSISLNLYQISPPTFPVLQVSAPQQEPNLEELFDKHAGITMLSACFAKKRQHDFFFSLTSLILKYLFICNYAKINLVFPQLIFFIELAKALAWEYWRIFTFWEKLNNLRDAIFENTRIWI